MLCAIFAKLDPRETEYKNMMDEHFLAEGEHEVVGMGLDRDRRRKRLDDLALLEEGRHLRPGLLEILGPVTGRFTDMEAL